MSWNDQIIDEFRSTGGHPGGFFEGAPMLLLHNQGARSGQPRINPLIYAEHDDAYFVAASKGGADSHPDWYYNLLANPDVTVEVENESFEATAKVHDSGPERDALYPLLEAVFPTFSEYKSKTDRVIPVIALRRKA